MRFPRTSWFVAVSAVFLGLASLSTGGEKGKTTPDKDKKQGTVHTVEASVVYPTNAGIGIQAEKQPGEFTIPKGSSGKSLKYSFFNPKSGHTLTKLHGSNIFSVTEHRYMNELDKNPDFELPPGEYKFVVGGEPGSMGTLRYTTVPGSDSKPPAKPPKDKKKRHGPFLPTADPASLPKDPLNPGGEQVLLNLPKNFDVTYAEGPLKEHPWIFRFRGEEVTMQNRVEMSYPIAEGGKSVYTYQSEITGTFRRGILSGKYVCYATGGHFGAGPIYSVGLYYKTWIRGDVSAQADSDTTTKGLLKLVINMNRHKHLDRPRGQEENAPWGPWRDNTTFMEDPSQVAQPWKPEKMTILLKLPVGELQSSQKFVPDEKVPPIPQAN